MLTYLLDYIRNGIVSYSYHPEGKEDYTGHVLMDEKTGELVEIARSKHPYEKHAPMYGNKMYGRMRSLRESGSFEESGIVAWC